MPTLFLDWSPELQAAAIGALVGGCLGILGAILGGWMQGLAWYRFEQKRAANEKHEQWVQIAREWVANGRKASLRGADLHGANLRGVDFSMAPIVGNATDRSRPKADLSYANLEGADLTGANLGVADLTGANLKRAKLQGVRVSLTILRDVDLRHAELENTDLSGSLLTGADLSGVDLRRVKLVWPHLQGAKLVNANLSDMDLPVPIWKASI